MKVLLLGEYSRLHNTLKEGLIANGHQVTLVGDGDGFKNYPVDISLRPTMATKPMLSFIIKVLYRLFKFNFNTLEKGIRCYLHLSKLKGFDVVQLINEKPIKTYPAFERFLLKKIKKHNAKLFLLSCGADTFSVQYMLDKKPLYSILLPYLENPYLKPDYQYHLDYLKPSHQKTHRWLLEHVDGIMATDFDYVAPLKEQPKFKGLIPNPVKIVNSEHVVIDSTKPIIVFLGINEGNYHAKGIPYFEEVLERLEQKYSEKIKIIKVRNVPYSEYITLYNSAHILLDQVYSFDQGYNALEAMAVGKVVFTGAEKDFLDYYNLSQNEVCINATPDVDQMIEQLVTLIDSPEKILEIGNNAQKFIQEHHNYKKIAQKYETVYKTGLIA